MTLDQRRFAGVIRNLFWQPDFCSFQVCKDGASQFFGNSYNVGVGIYCK